jgi:hypothetical protein
MLAQIDDSVVSPLRDYLLRTYGFHASAQHLAFLGRCRQCREALSAPSDRASASPQAPERPQT